MVELADTRDLKSLGALNLRVGSTPTNPTIFLTKNYW